MGDVAPARVSASTATFNYSELKAMITAAREYGVKVACHAMEHDTIVMLENLGVHSIEHGHHLRPTIQRTSQDLTSDLAAARLVGALVRSNTFWVPTLSALYTFRDGDGGAAAWADLGALFRAVIAQPGAERIIAVGGDTGTFAHGRNALEMQLMVRLGAPWRQVLQWATLSGWRCVRPMTWEGSEGEARLKRAEEELTEDPRVVGDNEVPFGAIRRGWAADIIAVEGDLENAFEEAIEQRSVKFVMKSGKVFKRTGLEVTLP